MINIELYQKGDWDKIETPVEPFVPEFGDGEFDKLAEHGIAVTATDEDGVFACGGVTLLNDESGTVWVKIRNTPAISPISMARCVREVFDIMVNSVGGCDISTYVLDGFTKGEKLARFIGMEKNCKSVEFNNHKYNRFTMVV